MAFTQTSDVFGSSLFAKLNAIVVAVRLSSEKHAVFKRTFDELNALSDAELNDIGIARAQIVEISRAEAAKLG